MNNEKKVKIRESLSLLEGLKAAIDECRYYACSITIANDYNRIVSEVCLIIGKDANAFLIPSSHMNEERKTCNVEAAKSKVNQMINLLKTIEGCGTDEKMVTADNLLKSIKDKELQSRCIDLLSAKDNFDRVINQATLVLEDRIRVKSEIVERLEGVKLVNKVLNTDLSKTVLKVSDNPDEQQGFCDMCRGIMLSFRNPTHHHLTDKFTREDALKQCAFIDLLLGMVDSAEKVR